MIMDKLQVGDLVRLRPGAGWSGIGLVMETVISRAASSACVLIDEKRWWIPYEKLEKISNG